MSQQAISNNLVNATVQTGSQYVDDKNPQRSNLPPVDSSSKSAQTSNSQLQQVTDAVNSESQAQNNQQPESLNHEQMEKLAGKLQEFIDQFNKGLEFSVDEDSGRDVIKVIDKGTGELLRQYPSEEVLTLMSRLADSAGLLIHTQA